MQARPSAPHPASRLRALALGLALLAVTGAAFMPILSCGFINYDDPDYVTHNPHVMGGLKWENIAWALTRSHSNNWHPLTWMSHMLDCTIFGLKPAGHHAVSLLLHAGNTLLLFALILKLTGFLWRSAFVAALFALHPLHVESVAWISERKDVLSVFFGLLSLLAYVRYVRRRGANAHPQSHSGSWYLLALLLFALGLMSKPMLVTWPLVLLLLDWWPLQRINLGLRRLLLEKIPFILLSVASSCVTIWAQAAGDAIRTMEALPLGARLANVPIAYVRYLQKMFWPGNLALPYPYAGHWPVGWVAAATLLLVAVTLLAFQQRRVRPWLGVGWLWFLVALVPVIGIVQVGGISLADRYSYVPLVGIFILLAWGITEFAGKLLPSRAKLVLATGAVLVLLGCAILTVRQGRFWRDSETLFAHSAQVTGDNAVAQFNLGLAMGEQGRFAEAATCFSEVVRIAPDDDEAYCNLGLTRAALEQFPEAETAYVAALRLRPNYAVAHSHLAHLLLQLNRPEEALEHSRNALKLAPELQTAWATAGNVMMLQGKLPDAVEFYATATRLRPDDVSSQYNLAVALTKLGRAKEAIAHFQVLLQWQPDHAAALGRLALLLAAHPDEKIRNGAKAVQLASRAVELTSARDPAILDALGVAFAETGDFNRASATGQRAFQAAQASGKVALAERIRSRLELYQARQPYREPAVP